MINVLTYELKDEKTLVVDASDEHQSGQFEFYYDIAGEIPRVTWNVLFEATFFGRLSDAKPLLQNVLTCFQQKAFVMPKQLQGTLKFSRQR